MAVTWKVTWRALLTLVKFMFTLCRICDDSFAPTAFQETTSCKWRFLLLRLVIFAPFLKCDALICYRHSLCMATSPVPPPYTLKAACLNFGMWGCVLDVINRAKFQLDWFRGFGAPGGRKSLSPIDWRYRPYNSVPVRTNVLQCDRPF